LQGDDGFGVDDAACGQPLKGRFHRYGKSPDVFVFVRQAEKPSGVAGIHPATVQGHRFRAGPRGGEFPGFDDPGHALYQPGMLAGGIGPGAELLDENELVAAGVVRQQGGHMASFKYLPHHRDGAPGVAFVVQVVAVQPETALVDGEFLFELDIGRAFHCTSIIARTALKMNAMDTLNNEETWLVRKPVVRAKGAMVASQHYLASRAGAAVLAAGGNAVDAAVVTGLAIGSVEPWMSGLGGCGYMLIYLAEEKRTVAVDFGLRAPANLNPADYPLVQGQDSDLFEWPAVQEDRNVMGPYSFGVPGLVAGHRAALGAFGTLSWAEALQPAIALACAGLEVDWYASLRIAAAARNLCRYPASKAIYLPDGFVPTGDWTGPLPRIGLGCLAKTLSRLADAGAEDFYTGEIAALLVADAREAGASLSLADLAACKPVIREIKGSAYRDATVFALPGLTAGPALERALALLSTDPMPGSGPDAGAWLHYARSLRTAYRERLATAGDSGGNSDCTTHISVCDARGNMVALTQTLLSLFGSRVVLPRTGVLMNNGIMWFDPRPGRPNSLAPGKRPLSNMCPAIVERSDGAWFALGASGGRRIMPTVFQLLSYLVDFDMDLESACHAPRIDMSGSPVVTVDRNLPDEAKARLRADFKTLEAANGVSPSLFGCPNVVGHWPRTGMSEGASFVPSPRAGACGAPVD